MKTLLVMIAATCSTSIGDALLSKGMKQFGDVSALAPSQLWRVLGIFANPIIILGIFFAAGYFFLYTCALSWADLSVVQPLTAMSYIFVSLIAKFALHEKVGPMRWFGIVFIVAGIIIISRDSARASLS